MSNAPWRIRGPGAGVDSASRRRENLGQGDLDTCYILWCKWLQVGPYKASVKCCAHVIRVPFCDGECQQDIPGHMTVQSYLS